MKGRSAILFWAIGIIMALMLANALNDVRSDIFNISQKEVIVDGSTFPGLYYDIDSGTINDRFIIRPSKIDPDGASAVLSGQPDADGYRGVTYTTEAFNSDFSYEYWGSYQEISFLGEDYFAAYDKNQTSSMIDIDQLVPYLYEKSDNSNLLNYEQIDKILTDSDKKRTFNSSKPLKLKEGYKLAIKNIDPDGKSARVELSRDNETLDSKVVLSPTETSSIGDETYYYKIDLGNAKEIVIIAVHFNSIFARSGSNEEYIRVDGVFQISDTPLSLKVGQRFDKMSIEDIDPVSMTIKMDNKNNDITLSIDKDILLMNKTYMHTADQDDISANNPLRYYIYKDMG